MSPSVPSCKKLGVHPLQQGLKSVYLLGLTCWYSVRVVKHTGKSNTTRIEMLQGSVEPKHVPSCKRLGTHPLQQGLKLVKVVDCGHSPCGKTHGHIHYNKD